jgi:hypothetical protein
VQLPLPCGGLFTRKFASPLSKRFTNYQSFDIVETKGLLPGITTALVPPAERHCIQIAPVAAVTLLLLGLYQRRWRFKLRRVRGSGTACASVDRDKLIPLNAERACLPARILENGVTVQRVPAVSLYFSALLYPLAYIMDKLNWFLRI